MVGLMTKLNDKVYSQILRFILFYCFLLVANSMAGLKRQTLFYIRVELINNVVVVSGGRQRDSAIHVHVSFLPQTPFPSRLPHNIKQSSPGYTVGPWLPEEGKGWEEGIFGEFEMDIYTAQLSSSAVSDSLQPHGLQHTRPPCPSPARGAYANSCPSSRWHIHTVLFKMDNQQGHSEIFFLRDLIDPLLLPPRPHNKEGSWIQVLGLPLPPTVFLDWKLPLRSKGTSSRTRTKTGYISQFSKACVVSTGPLYLRSYQSGAFWKDTISKGKKQGGCEKCLWSYFSWYSQKMLEFQL